MLSKQKSKIKGYNKNSVEISYQQTEKSLPPNKN